MGFKDDYRELGEICRELYIVRNHNLGFKEWKPGYLMFSEGLLVLLAMERFLRAILGAEAVEGDPLPKLLEKATSQRLGLLTLPGVWTIENAVAAITSARNTLMNGNYEQAGAQAGKKNDAEYFGSSQYSGEVESLFQVLESIMGQIDPATGKP